MEKQPNTAALRPGCMDGAGRAGLPPLLLHSLTPNPWLLPKSCASTHAWSTRMLSMAIQHYATRGQVMGCLANSVLHNALRGQILALRRLDFDRQLPNADAFSSPCCLGCDTSATAQSDCCGYGWALGDAAVRPLCRLSPSQAEQALLEAQSLVNRGYRNLQSQRSALGKPAKV